MQLTPGPPKIALESHFRHHLELSLILHPLASILRAQGMLKGRFWELWAINFRGIPHYFFETPDVSEYGINLR